VTICVNAARSEYRRSQCRPQEDLRADVSGSWAPDDVAATALTKIERGAVSAALARLSEAQRVAVVLVDIGGLSARQAAEVLDVPRGTILSRVHRGRRELAAMLEREGYGRGD